MFIKQASAAGAPAALSQPPASAGGPIRPPSRLQVVIEGFKSYKDQTILDPFSNKVNVVGESIATSFCAGRPAPAWRACLQASSGQAGDGHWQHHVEGLIASLYLPVADAQAAPPPCTRPASAAVGANGSGKSNFFAGGCACCG